MYGTSTSAKVWPSTVTDKAAVKTTYSWDTIGRPLSIVQGDNNDDVAGTPPTCASVTSDRVEAHQCEDDPSCGYTEMVTIGTVVTYAPPLVVHKTHDCQGHVTSQTGSLGGSSPMLLTHEA